MRNVTGLCGILCYKLPKSCKEDILVIEKAVINPHMLQGSIVDNNASSVNVADD